MMHAVCLGVGIAFGVMRCSPGAHPGPDAAAAAQHAGRCTLQLRGTKVPATLQVEVALSPAQRARGLMGRRTMRQDEGMLFVFDETSEHTFWMRNTPLRLDLVFFDAAGRWVGEVLGAEPNTDDARSCHQASRYVLEVRAGVVEQLGICKDTAIDLRGLKLTSP